SLSVIPSSFEEIKKAMLDAKARDTRLRFITEITKENIFYTKELMESVELRHLDGVRGNFGVSDSEYIAISTIDAAAEPISARTTIPHAVYSNVIEDVQQQRYVFEILWNKATPAEQRIREIDEGVQSVSTRILEDQDQITHEIRRLNYSSNRLSVCSAFGGMQMGYRYLFDSYMNIVDKHRKGEGKGMRWIINIDKENLKLVKVFLKAGIQIRHVRNMPPVNFGVSDKEMAGTIEKMEEGKMSQSFLFSNEPLYITHFNSLFEEIWKDGTDAKQRIALIEEGADLTDIEIIPSTARARELYLDVLKKVQKEIRIVFPTTNAFLRQHKIGVIQLVKEATEQRNVRTRILMPRHELTKELAYSLTEGTYSKYNNIDLRYIKQTRLDTHATILVVDEKVSLIMEIRDDSKGTFDEAIGLSIYSNSRAGVLSHISIFENLWLQTELYDQISESSFRLERANEQLIAHDKMQKEFINIAAHELKTPIQPILSLTELLRSQTKDVKQQELLDITIRNAKRLQRLSNDILDVAKIEGRTLELNKEVFNINEVVMNAITDSTSGRDFLKHEKINVLYNPHKDVLIKADKGRILQVISNLLSNAMEFTAEGTILVSVEKDKINNNETIIVSVKDSGQGIDPSILPRLFTKFTSKSYKGTGLGLFISKGIIEAHGGKIWGENNFDGRGAKFIFSLPTR
ncbi:MAG: HAMP domain-containing sensor histidine kinase, partial [Candidatus Nitrosopolaris sp.]